MAYSPMLLVTGALLGELSSGTILENGYKIFLQIDPHGMLMILIPILIFDMGFKVKYYYFKQIFWQILILALPVLFVNLMILAFVLKWVLEY